MADVQGQMFTIRDFATKGPTGLFEFNDEHTAFEAAYGDVFLAPEQRVVTSLRPHLLALYNTYAIIHNPQDGKILPGHQISIEIWTVFYYYRAKKEAEAKGGDHTSQLTSFVVKTIHELICHSVKATFADNLIRYVSPIKASIVMITSDSLTGAFRALLEQALRKYEGRTGDTKQAMLGGILEYAKCLPKNVDRIGIYVDMLLDLGSIQDYRGEGSNPILLHGPKRR